MFFYAFFNRLFDFFKLSEEKNDLFENKKLLTSPKNNFIIEFKDVSFKYPGSKSFSLKDTTLKINFGKNICLVGENGSGKSTFINLLLRIYTPQKGEILLNDVNI